MAMTVMAITAAIPCAVIVVSAPLVLITMTTTMEIVVAMAHVVKAAMVIHISVMGTAVTICAKKRAVVLRIVTLPLSSPYLTDY